MKQKIKNNFQKVLEYYKLHPKRFWALGGIIVIALLYAILHKTPSTITVVPVTRGDLQSTVLATGQVTAATDLDLSFPVSGLIETLPVSVGDKVGRGQVLAMLGNASEYASLKLAQANYQKVADGSSNEEVAVAQTSLTNAQTSLQNIQRTQDTLVENAHQALLNADLTPALTSGTTGTAPSVTGTYSGDAEGSYVVTPHLSGSTSYFTYSGIEAGTGTISTTTPMALGTKGLFMQFNADYVSNQNDVWTVLLPNTKSLKYLSAYSAYQNTLKTRDSAVAGAQASVDEAQANLNLKKASARPADLAAAQASVDQAMAVYENTVLRAPTAGTIVHVDTKIGERADAQKEVVVLQDVGSLHVEANINETSIAKVAIGQPVVMTLDAFGPDMRINGTVIQIDPSSTTSDGVVNYKIKVSIIPPCADGAVCAVTNNMIRPGMNANMTITAWDHQNVVAIPKAALDIRADGAYVRLVLDDKNKKFEERKITTGLLGDGNLIEVLTGLSEGEKVAVGN